MIKAILALAIPVAFGAGLLIGTNAPLQTTKEATYEFIMTTPIGNEFVEDYNLSKEDCLQRIRDYADFDPETTKGIECRKEPSQ